MKLAQNRLGELAKLFLKLGLIGFGGPASHIAMMEDEVVSRRQWLTKEHFLDLVGATNLIPGPNSTEMAIHVGYIRSRWWGLVVAGVCFILPAALITGGLAWVYVALGKLPQVTPFFYGVKPAVLAVILNAVWRLGKKAVKNRQLLLIGVAVAMGIFLGLNEVLALFVGGILGMFWLQFGSGAMGALLPLSFLSQLHLTHSSAFREGSIVGDVPLWQLGLFFLKVGSVLFGGGYVLIAFLQEGLVDKLHWLTQQQLLDALAIGQFTPGPVLSTATFIGYVIAGVPGAIVATIGIFLPSFFFVAILNPLIPRLRDSEWMATFLDAINVSAIALMVTAMIKLAQGILLLPNGIDLKAALIALSAAILLIRWRVNAAGIILGGAAVGGLLQLV